MENLSSEIPPEVSNILVDLDVIAKIPAMHKFNTRTKTYVDANSWTGAGLRTWYGEDCDITIDYINEQITKAIETARKNKIWQKLILEKVTSIQEAIVNLRSTYSLNSKNANRISKFNLIILRIHPTALLNTCIDKKK